MGGTFTSVAPHGSTRRWPASNIFAFDATTGRRSTPASCPTVDGEVDAIIPGPGNTVYIAGSFTTVNGVKEQVALLDLTTGKIVAGWAPPTFSAATTSLVVSGGKLFVGGSFTKVGTQQRSAAWSP